MNCYDALNDHLSISNTFNTYPKRFQTFFSTNFHGEEMFTTSERPYGLCTNNVLSFCIFDFISFSVRTTYIRCCYIASKWI